MLILGFGLLANKRCYLIHAGAIIVTNSGVCVVIGRSM